jgi:hypothetical protein
MLYGAIWRALPGPLPVRILLAGVLVLAVVAFCFLWLFPRIAPLMPFNDNTVDPAALRAPTQVVQGPSLTQEHR